MPQNQNLKFKKEFFFLIKFFVIFAVLQFLILVLPLAPLQEFIAGGEAGALGMESHGNTIFWDSQRFEIKNNCTGLVSGAILAAVIFSLKKPSFKKKFLIAITGGIGLFLLNLPRIWIVLAIAKSFGAGLAETLHEITWITTALLVLLIWYIATKKIAGIKNFSELI
ncbi:MAG: exosortase/archaeosortase family protein [Candidatus ainarchaeum sp.]|nr:exosortase/archaeosortase family protein [Candidatus ainarchaeum sp.]